MPLSTLHLNVKRNVCYSIAFRRNKLPWSRHTLSYNNVTDSVCLCTCYPMNFPKISSIRYFIYLFFCSLSFHVITMFKCSFEQWSLIMSETPCLKDFFLHGLLKVTFSLKWDSEWRFPSMSFKTELVYLFSFTELNSYESS